MLRVISSFIFCQFLRNLRETNMGANVRHIPSGNAVFTIFRRCSASLCDW